MPDTLKRAAAWLGLVQETDRYRDHDDDDELTEEVYNSEIVEMEPSTVTPIRRDRGEIVPADHPSTPAATTPRTADLARIITIQPRTYNEARTIGEHFRDGVPVIMNLSDMDDGDAKRLVDFAAGLSFGLWGTIERVTNKVFLLSPKNVNVTPEDKQRIANSGFFNQS